MRVQDFAKLIRQTPKTVRKRCGTGEIPAKKLKEKIWGGWGRWEIDDNYIKNLIGKHGN